MNRHLFSCLLLVLLMLVFGPTLVWLWQRWTISIWHNGHGMFVPVVVAYLGYQFLKTEASRNEESSPWGFLFLIPGLLLVVADSAIRTQLLSAIGLIFSIIGLTLLLLGARRSKALGYPLVLLFLMLPIPTAFIDRLVLVLRRISAVGCEHLTSLTGLPVYRDFTTLHFPNSTLEIADACSGFSTLYASVTMVLILAYITPSTKRRILILSAAVPVAIGCNILRCTLLAYLIHYRGSEVLVTPLHPMTGIFSFSLALAILFSLSLFRASKTHADDSNLATVSAADHDSAAADAAARSDPLVR